MKLMVPPRVWGGGVLGYLHTYVGSGHFFGFKILNVNIFFCFSEKNEYFLGHEDFLGIITKLDSI